MLRKNNSRTFLNDGPVESFLYSENSRTLLGNSITQNPVDMAYQLKYSSDCI